MQDLDEIYNPVIRGWIVYFGNFYRTQLRPTLKRIDLYVIRWARRTFKRLVHQTKGAETGSAACAERIPCSLPIGRYAMETAEHREPCDSRGSCTVLGAPGGETPSGDSTCTANDNFTSDSSILEADSELAAPGNYARREHEVSDYWQPPKISRVD
jgi:hypothetical protein